MVDVISTIAQDRLAGARHVTTLCQVEVHAALKSLKTDDRVGFIGSLDYATSTFAHRMSLARSFAC
jgi:hypothetical protein